MHHELMHVLATIGIVSLISQWLAWRLRVPAILFLLAGGILLGPTLGFLRPDEQFGPLLFPIVSLAVAVILFEGSLTLNFAEIRGHGVVVRRLITTGVFIIWAAVTLVTHYLLGLSWQLSLLFGAIMTVTGPTVIMPMLQAVRPTPAVSNILRWEGILVDPIGAILAVLTFTLVLATQLVESLDNVVLLLVRMLASGFIVGGLAGYIWGHALRRYWIPQFLHNVATLLLVFAVFALADTIESESGLLAVTVMGIWLANTRGVHIEEILNFKESLSILLISGLFVLLAARLEFSQITMVGWPALLLVLSIQFIARPIKVFLCTVGSSLSWQERTALAWIGPRGIIAAAISAIFALRLEQQGYADAGLLVALAFVVIVGTVVIQSFTAAPLARMLGVAMPEPEGVLIVGGSPLTAKLGQILKDNGFTVTVSHTNWDGLRAARMAGLNTFYGNLMSDHADRMLDLSGIGKLFALSRNTEFNHLACSHFSRDFGRQNVYFLPVSVGHADSIDTKHAVSRSLAGRALFSGEVSLAKLLSLVSQGAELKTTRLSESFTYEDYLEQGGDSRIPLLAWDSKGHLIPSGDRGRFKPAADWTVVGLVTAEALEAKKDKKPE